MSYQRSSFQTILGELFSEYMISLTANRGVNRETSGRSLDQERPVVLKPSRMMVFFSTHCSIFLLPFTATFPTNEVRYSPICCVRTEMWHRHNCPEYQQGRLPVEHIWRASSKPSLVVLCLLTSLPENTSTFVRTLFILVHCLSTHLPLAFFWSPTKFLP